MLNRPKPSRRPITRPVRKPAERDPYLAALLSQLAVSTLLVVLCYLLVDANPPFLKQISQQYHALLTAEKAEFGSIPQMGTWKDDVLDACADFIETLATPRDVQPDLDGQGGWFGIGDGDGKTAPSSCDLSPVVSSAPVLPPVGGKVTCVFGYRIHPTNGLEDFHNGVDIAAPQGSGIHAALPGTVSEISNSAIYGNYIILDHGGGFHTVYCHCDTIVAPLGANLRQGELIATVGSTGISTGPHCHFEIVKDGKYYNPAWVLSGMNGYGV